MPGVEFLQYMKIWFKKGSSLAEFPQIKYLSKWLDYFELFLFFFFLNTLNPSFFVPWEMQWKQHIIFNNKKKELPIQYFYSSILSHPRQLHISVENPTMTWESLLLDLPNSSNLYLLCILVPHTCSLNTITT